MVLIPFITSSNTGIDMIFGSLFKKKQISINVKLLTGLDKIEGYDPQQGFQLLTEDGIKLKKALKPIALPWDQPISFLINGEKASSNSHLKEGDEVFCFLPFAGG